MSSALSRELRTDRIDVILLLEAPIDLAFSVISQGEILYERDVSTRIDCEARIMGLYFDYLPFLRLARQDIIKGGESMLTGFDGIERRLDELRERLARLWPLQEKPRHDFDADPYLRDIAE